MTDLKVWRDSLRGGEKRKESPNQPPVSSKKSRREGSSAVPTKHTEPSTPSTVASSCRSTVIFGGRHTAARLAGRNGMQQNASATGLSAALLATTSSAVTGAHDTEGKENAGVGDVWTTQHYAGHLMGPEDDGGVSGPQQLEPTELMDGQAAGGQEGAGVSVVAEMSGPVQLPISNSGQVMEQSDMNMPNPDQQSDVVQIGGQDEGLYTQVQQLEHRIQQLEQQSKDGAAGDEDEEELQITVTDPRLKKDGRTYVQYTVRTQCRGRTVCVFHRYREFSALHTTLTASYAHLLPIVPPLPAKNLAGALLVMLSNGDFAPDSRTGKFIASRRAALEDWPQAWQTALQAVLRVDPAWRRFLGLDGDGAGAGRTDDPLRVLYSVTAEAVACMPAVVE